jgi:hypothetical protein
MKPAYFKKLFIGFIGCCLALTGYAATPPPHKKNSNIVHPEEPSNTLSPEQPARTGNFAVRVSQQPAPFIAFGQNIIDKNQLQLYLFGDYFHGPGQHLADALPYLVYGLTDNSSLLLSLPVALTYTQGNASSQGLEDASIQYEVGIYSKATSNYEDQATFVAAVNLPTGSGTSNPPTGAGAPGFFLGTTFNRTYNDWLLFASPGALINTTHNSMRYGNQYYYQAGVGRNIAYSSSKWTLTWMVEADGQFSAKNKYSGVNDPDSGSNVVYITPSLFYARHNLILQAGFGIPCVQQLNGDQTLNNYFVAANVGWTFN